MALVTSPEPSKNAAGMGSGPGGAFLRPDECSNNETSSCPSNALKDCTNCHLVQYCGTECQQAHWPIHKVDCRSPLAKIQWRPDFVDKNRVAMGGADLGDSIEDVKHYFGNTPEYDILNMEANEGIDYDKDLELLFAASGDLRCVMKTINQISPVYKQKIEVVLNELDTEIVLRNAVMLLLAFVYPDGEASELIIHFWYSAALPFEIIEDEANNAVFSKIWEFGQSSLRLTLMKHQWDRLLDQLELKHTLPIADATKERKSVMVDGLNEAQKDVIDQVALTRNTFHRLCDKKWREIGLLLPFAHDGQGFDVPNPTFFGPSKKWKATWSPRQSPLTSSDIIIHGYRGPKVPSNDTNGMLFFARRSMIEKFCKAIQTLSVDFCMYQGDARKIGRTLAEAKWHRPDLRFDRIDTSNIADDGYLHLPTTLSACDPLLKKQHENPHATLLTHFMMVLSDVETHRKKYGYKALELSDEKVKLLKKLVTKAQTTWSKHGRDYNAWISYIAMMLMDYEELFKRYKHIYQFAHSALATGVEERVQHKVVDKFPLRIDTDQDIDALRRQVQLRIGYSEGSITFVEWGSHDRVETKPEQPMGEAFPMPGNPSMMVSHGLPGLGPNAGGLSNVLCMMDEEGKKNMEKLVANMNLNGGPQEMFGEGPKESIEKFLKGLGSK